MPDTSRLIVELELHLDRAREIAAVLAGRRVDAQVHRSWVFNKLTGVLTSPFSVSIKLHAGEAAVIGHLAKATDRRGTFAELTAIVGESAARPRNHLAILVSRMRRRAQLMSIEIPIVGERSRGYIFLDPIEVLVT